MQMGDTGSKGGWGRWGGGGGGHSRWEGTLAPGMSHPSQGLTIYVPGGTDTQQTVDVARN